MDDLNFDLVLTQDIANIVKKSAAGQPLTARERELMLAEKARREKVARVASEPGEKKKPVVRSGRAAVSGFKEAYDFYSKIYGSSERTIKRWVKRGKDVEEEVPLDEPLRMRGWWTRHMKLRCPPGILQAEVRAKNEGEEDISSPPAVSPEGQQEVFNVEFENEELGLGGALDRLEKMELILGKKAGEPGQTKPWLDTISRMTSVASKLREELVEQKKLVAKNEAAAEIKVFHGQMISVLKNFLPDERMREVSKLFQEEIFVR